METDKQLNDALELINSQDYTGAKALLENIVKNNPDNLEAIKNLGLCEVNLDSPTDAIRCFEKAVELKNDDAVSIFYLASCKAKIGEKEEAINYFKKVLELRPDYIEVYKSLAMIYVEFNQAQSAIELLLQALNNPEIQPDYSIYYILSTSYMLIKDYNNSSKYLEKALELNPEHIAIANSLAVSYMNTNRYTEALALLNNTFAKDDKNSLTAYNLAMCYQSMNDFKNALKYLQISYQIEPSVTMLASLASCAFSAGEYALSATLYQNLVMVYPNNASYRLAYTEALENTKNYKEALDNVNQLLMVDEKNIGLIKKKGALLRKLGFFEESIATFEQLLKRGKIDVEVYYNFAFNYVELNDFDKASEMFKKCITLEPNNPYAHKDLGVLYLKMNCYDWAIDEMLQAIKLEDDVAEFYYSLGVCYMMLSNIEDAIIAFNKANELEPDDADNCAYLGYAYLLQNKRDVAFSFLDKAIKLAPDNFLAKTFIAKYYFTDKKYEIAKQFLLDAIDIIKDDETLNMLAICYMKTNEFENAMGIFSKLIVKYSNSHILLTNLAKCELKCNKKSEAKEHLRQALMIFDDYDEALKLLEEINND